MSLPTFGPLRVVSVVAVLLAAIAIGAPGAAAARGDTVTGAFGYAPDAIDPQDSWSGNGWEAMWDTYIPLLTYRHAGGLAGSEVIPGLARSLPRITDGGRTYTLHLRRGLRYSDGEPVRASDFKYAIERAFRLERGGQYYYDDIVGAVHFELHRRGGIRGIVTDDRSGKIVIRLQRPDRSFSRKLALLWTAPVPRGTPEHDLTRNPPPATGPYEITSSTVHGLTYARNPAWRRNGRLMPQIPGGHFNRARIVYIPNTRQRNREVARGKLDWTVEELSGAASAALRRRFPSSRLRYVPTLSTYYFWMNTTQAPFDDIRVRRAVNYAVDRSAFTRDWGGQMQPTEQILPPDLPGYRSFDPYPHDLAKARRLIAAADPRDRDITVWASAEPDYTAPFEDALNYADVLQQLGFTVHLRVIDPDNYFTAIGESSRADLDTGVGNYFADYPDPDDFLRASFGYRPTAYYNENFSRLFVPGLSRRLDRLNAGTGPTPEGAYAALDRRYTRLAPWVSYGTLRLPLFVSRRVDVDDAVYNPSFGLDLTSLRRARGR